MTNPILAEINGLSPGAKTALLNAHQANSNPTPAPATPAPVAQLHAPSQIPKTPTIGAPPPIPALPASVSNGPSPSIMPSSQPAITAPKGTVQADENERGRLLATGSGIHQIKNPVLHGLAGVGNAVGTLAAPGLMRLIPGTEEHHNLLLGKNLQNIGNDLSIANKEATNQELTARAPLEEAQTDNLLHPPSTALPTSEGYFSFNPRTGSTAPISGANGQPLQPYVKPGNRQHVVLQDANGDPMIGFVDPSSGITTDAQGRAIPNPVPYEKEGAQHPVAGVVEGNQRFGLYTPNGWVDPDTKQPLKGFQPAPTFAQTGLWQPTEGIDPKTGQLVPGRMNERTGQFVANGTSGPSALPKDVTAELGKEYQTAREADKRLRIMEQNETEALKGDQQAMLSLVANHIGMTLGAQKGARINQAVWDEAVKSAPWLQNVKKVWNNQTGLLQGVTLSPEQIKQMVALGQVVRDQQWKQVEDAFGNYGIPIGANGAPGENAPASSNSRPQSSGTGVRLSDAMNLPQNKGKSRQDVIKDIEAHGHTVIQ